MNNYEINNFLDPKRHILALSAGVVGSFLPNDKSNSSPLINGAIFAAIVVKLLYGDYDKGYIWSLSDIVFWIITAIEGLISAYFITYLVIDKK